jgi:predicted aspartyl protease
MTRLETAFELDDDLIIVKSVVSGPLGTTSGRFVLDTGAVMTTMSHELAGLLGYSARDGIRRARVRTAIGSEEGYVLAVADFTALQCPRPGFQVHVFDLGYDDIDGLLGMNFLGEMNYEVRSTERQILVEAIEPAAPAVS